MKESIYKPFTMRSCIAAICLILMALCVEARSVIKVRSQSDFDDLGRNIVSAAKSGETALTVRFDPGPFVAKDGQLTLSGIVRPDLSIRLSGQSTVILPDGKDYNNGERFSGVFDVNCSWMSGSGDIDIWSRAYYADGLAEVLDEAGKECRIKPAAQLPDKEDLSGSYILIPHWYRSSIYGIDRVEDGYIYFQASDLAPSYGNFNINDDWNYGRKEIRFKLCNASLDGVSFGVRNGVVSLPEGVTSARCGKACRIIDVRNCSFKSLQVEGFRFRGNGYSASAAVINLQKVDCQQAVIRNCLFEGIRSNVITISSSANVSVENNVFSNCYYDGIKSDNSSPRTTVKGNRFSGMGKRMQNTFCVVCRGDDFSVSDNEMTDYGYGGIGAGVWYRHDQLHPCKGIIENNTLIHTADYIGSAADNCIMDSGAIYLWTRNDGTVVRGNRIMGYTGMKDNRGIFCDDGARNVLIHGNLITGVINSYSIDSRQCASVEDVCGPANVNNSVYDNIVDRPIRFQGRGAAGNGCSCGPNYIIAADKPVVSDYSNVSVESADITVSPRSILKGRIVLPYSEFRALRASSRDWRNLRGSAGWL